MKVILNEDIYHLGEEGDICDVANGYARNYLFPKKLAMPCNKNSLYFLEQKKEAIEKRKEEKHNRALDIKEKIEQEELIFTISVGESGKLFGSVTNAHIAEELGKKGYTIEKKRIEVPDHHIKMLGEYKIKIKLYKNEVAELKVTVKALEKEKKKNK